VLLITGAPGTGKTTVLTKTVNLLRERGFSVGGMLSREIREGGVRVGFEIIDLETQKRGWLANIKQSNGPQVGKYRVNIDDLEAVGVQAMIHAAAASDIIAIDEIGPMELSSEKFKEVMHNLGRQQNSHSCGSLEGSGPTSR
jgi:nucleoside-triphosphatase